VQYKSFLQVTAIVIYSVSLYAQKHISLAIRGCNAWRPEVLQNKLIEIIRHAYLLLSSGASAHYVSYPMASKLISAFHVAMAHQNEINWQHMPGCHFYN